VPDSNGEFCDVHDSGAEQQRLQTRRRQARDRDHRARRPVSEGPTQAYDYQEPYLLHLLGFMGLTDVSFVHAERIGRGSEVREAAITRARAQLRELVNPSPTLSPA
jgi:hypothetical protein